MLRLPPGAGAATAQRRGELYLPPYLEQTPRAQLTHVVGHVGLIVALRRISGDAARPAERTLGQLTSAPTEPSSW